MRRAVPIGAMVSVVALLFVMSGSALAETASWTYYKDKFQERDYDGNDAAGSFSSDWIEVGEANGPVKGYVTISDHSYCYTYCLQIGAGDLAVGNVGIARSINLDNALEAKLTFIFATDLYGGSTEQEIALQISADGGESFTTLETYRLDRDEDMERQDYITITEWAAPHTVIRFISLEGAPTNVLLVDDFLVKGKFIGDAPPPTTTTTSTSTTTTTTTTLPPTTTTTTTTTTTLPPTTTTTTTTTLPPVDTTTTSAPPRSTSTTSTTTTTVPPDTTTTTVPPTSEFGAPPPGSDEHFRTKDALVVTDVSRARLPGTIRDGNREPVSLAVSFRTTAEAFTGGALPSTLLGVLIAVLAVVGLSRGLKPGTR